MPALLVLVAVAALLVGAVVGWAWAVHSPARWCGGCGDSLRCLTCSPVTATGRAAVRWQGRLPASTVDRPLMTRAAENRASTIHRRRSI